MSWWVRSKGCQPGKSELVVPILLHLQVLQVKGLHQKTVLVFHFTHDKMLSLILTHFVENIHKAELHWYLSHTMSHMSWLTCAELNAQCIAKVCRLFGLVKLLYHLSKPESPDLVE